MSIKALIEKKNDLITRSEELTNAAETEGRDLTEDELKEVENNAEEVRSIERQLNARNAVKAMAKEVETRADEPAEAKEETQEEADTRAFAAHIRELYGAMNTREDLKPLTKGANGAVVPQTIANKIIRKVYDICPIAERATKYEYNGTLNIPKYTEDDTNYINVGFQGAEFAEIEANSGKFTSISLTDFVAGALVLISRQLINASDFDLVGYVIDQMAYSIKRFLERVLLNGSGVISGQTGTVEGLTGVTLNVEAAAANAITSNELIDVQDKVKDEFQENAIWIMSPATRSAIRKLKDNMGRYLLNENVANAFGRELLGKPLYVSDNMPEMEAGKVAIYYGDLSGLALKFTKNLEIQVLREKYATSYADGINGWFSFDSKVENAQKIAKLVMGNQVSA